MNLIELFCGCGGFSLGAHRAGFRVAAAYDIDKILTSSYPLNFPATKLLHRDIATLSGHEIKSDVAEPIVGIFGGPPCQGFSSIGKRLKDDPRRDLLRHFFRIVAEIQPEFFVMENVRGLAYRDAQPVLAEALQLVEHDYDILGPHIWNAADFGAATVRSRVFVIGVKKSTNVELTRQQVEEHMRPPATVREAIADLQDAQSLGETSLGFDNWRIKSRAAQSSYSSGLRSADNEFTGHRSTVHSPAVIERFRAVLPGKMETVGRHPRLRWEGQCPTLRAGTGADRGSFQSVRPIHPTEPRVITVREAARLQGFPDDHVFHPTIWHSFRMIGNSVSPIIAEAIFTAIRDRLAERHSTPTVSAQIDRVRPSSAKQFAE